MADAQTTLDPVGNDGDGGQSLRPNRRRRVPSRLALRRQARLTGLLALLGLLLGVATANHIVKPVYRAEALLRLDTANTDGPHPEVNIDPESSSLTKATTSHALRLADPALVWGKHNAVPTLEAEALPGGSIRVSMEHRDPALAIRMLNAAVERYLADQPERSPEVEAVVAALEVERRTARQELQQAQREARETSERMGAAAVGQLYESQSQRAADLEQELARIGAHLLQLIQEQSPPPPTIETLAATDGRIAALLNQRQQAEKDLARLRTVFGNEHRAVRQLHGLIADLQDRLDRAVTLTVPDTVTALTARREQLEAQQQQLHRALEGARRQLADLERLQLAMARQHDRQAAASQKLEAIEQHLAAARREAIATAPLRMVHAAAAGDQPHRDLRPLATTLLGLAGMMLVSGPYLAAAWLFPRITTLADARDVANDADALPVLGVLPLVPADPLQPQRLMATAHSIHAIRAFIQTRSSRSHTPGGEPEQGRAFAVTSPVAHSGKSSLSMALALSFAPNHRTLLIDGDLSGTGDLTTRARSILRQAHNAPAQGLREALRGAALSTCVMATEIDRLDVLPLGGGADGFHRLDPQAMQRVLDQARNEYAIVIMDTGAVLGGYEATVICAQANGVVLTVSRGEQRQTTEQAVAHLRSCGVNLLGLVYNRAQQRDLDRDAYTSQPGGAWAKAA